MDKRRGGGREGFAAYNLYFKFVESFVEALIGSWDGLTDGCLGDTNLFEIFGMRCSKELARLL